MPLKNNRKAQIIVVCAALLLAVVLGVGVYYKTSLKAVSATSKPVTFQVAQGMGNDAVLAQLKEKKLIRNTTMAKLYMKLHGLNDIKAGNFAMDASWDTPKVLETLNSVKQAKANETLITFKEGMWAKDVAKLIEQKMGIPRKELLALWNDDAYLKTLIKKYPFLTKDILNTQYKVKLEGYLFPETYSFHKNATAKEITETFLDHFGSVYDKYADDIKASHKSVQEVMTFASIVQYEASKENDMKMIAGVFNNRMKLNMPLGSSVTVCYALYDDMKSSDDCEVKTDIESPYNTYLHTGLPIGPILNPGEAAIQAVLHPKKNDYLYFVADIYGDGTVYYAKTLSEQEANIDKYNLRK